MKTVTATQYGRLIAKLGLSQVKAGHFLGFTPRTSRRIIAGEAELPLAAAKLLRLMVRQDLTPDDVDAIFSKPVLPQTEISPA
jgi:hypothetical protein